MREDKEAELKNLEAMAAARETRLLTEAASKHRDLQVQLDELKATLASVMEYKNRQVGQGPGGRREEGRRGKGTGSAIGMHAVGGR